MAVCLSGHSWLVTQEVEGCSKFGVQASSGSIMLVKVRVDRYRNIVCGSWAIGLWNVVFREVCKDA